MRKCSGLSQEMVRYSRNLSMRHEANIQFHEQISISSDTQFEKTDVKCIFGFMQPAKQYTIIFNSAQEFIDKIF